MNSSNVPSDDDELNTSQRLTESDKMLTKPNFKANGFTVAD